MVTSRLVQLTRKIGLRVFALLPAVLTALPVFAGDNAISVHQAEIRATSGAMTATGGYLRIANSGYADLTLVRVDADFAAKAEIHMMFAEDDVMKMRPLESGLVIPAHGEALLKPGGVHLMFIGLTGAMRPGTMQHITLHFDTGHTVSVVAKVKKPADIGGTAHAHSEIEHDHADDLGDVKKMESAD